MKKIEVEVFGEVVNMPVIRYPGRKYPGILIQGDSLRILVKRFSELKSLIAKDQINVEANDLIEEMESLLGMYYNAYSEAARNLPADRKEDEYI